MQLQEVDALELCPQGQFWPKQQKNAAAPRRRRIVGGHEWDWDIVLHVCPLQQERSKTYPTRRSCRSSRVPRRTSATGCTLCSTTCYSSLRKARITATCTFSSMRNVVGRRLHLIRPRHIRPWCEQAILSKLPSSSASRPSTKRDRLNGIISWEKFTASCSPS